MAEGVWALGEERDGEIHPVSYEMLAWGRSLADALGAGLTAVIVGAKCVDGAQELIYHGADSVRAVVHQELATFRVEPYTRILVRLIQEGTPAVLIASATTMGRTLMPVVAAKMRLGLTADCTDLEIDATDGLLIQTRPAIGGNVMAMIKTPGRRPQMATVRPRSRRPLTRDADRRGEIITETANPADLASRVARLAFDPDTTSDVGLQDAEVVVAGGRGLKNAEGFRQVFALAERLGGAVGASRVAVDQGWVPYSHQVGLSGKSVTPKLYFALGISGSANHLAGMSSSETVVAVNKDPEAEIFKVCDFGIVGDVAEIVPALLARLDRATAQADAQEGEHD